MIDDNGGFFKMYIDSNKRVILREGRGSNKNTYKLHINAYHYYIRNGTLMQVKSQQQKL